MLLTSLFNLRACVAQWSLRTILCRLLGCSTAPTVLERAADKRRLEAALQAEGLSRAAAVRTVARLCRGAGRG